jgi:hypothetical protein
MLPGGRGRGRGIGREVQEVYTPPPQNTKEPAEPTWGTVREPVQPTNTATFGAVYRATSQPQGFQGLGLSPQIVAPIGTNDVTPPLGTTFSSQNTPPLPRAYPTPSGGFNHTTLGIIPPPQKAEDDISLKINHKNHIVRFLQILTK